MTAKISKWGNSQGLRVTKDLMRDLQLNIGDSVNITIKNGKAILEPVRNDIPNYNLDNLVSKIPSNYKTNEEFDLNIGKEEW